MNGAPAILPTFCLLSHSQKALCRRTHRRAPSAAQKVRGDGLAPNGRASIREHQTTNLGVRSSNLFGRASNPLLQLMFSNDSPILLPRDASVEAIWKQRSV